MKISEVAFRDAVYFDGKKTISSKESTFELHPAGVIVNGKDRKSILVPFSNILWIGRETEAAKPK